MADSIYVNSPTGEEEGNAVYESCALQEMPSTCVGPTSEETDSPPKTIGKEPESTVLSSKYVMLIFGANLITMLGVIVTLIFCVLSQARLQADLQKINITVTEEIADIQNSLREARVGIMQDLQMINITVTEARQSTHDEMLERSSKDIANMQNSLWEARAGIIQEIEDMNEHLRKFENMTGNGFLRINESLHYINMSTETGFLRINKSLNFISMSTANRLIQINESLNDINMTTSDGFKRMNESLHGINITTANGFLRINESLNYINMSTANRFLRINESLNYLNMSTANRLMLINESLNDINMTTADGLIRINESLNDINMTTADGFMRINQSVHDINMIAANGIESLKNTSMTEKLTRCLGHDVLYSADRCYKFYLGSMNFEQAKAECQKHGNVLARIDNRPQQVALQDWIRQTLPSGDPELWIGMIHHPTEGTLEYPNGMKIGRSIFQWHGGHPQADTNLVIEVSKNDPTHGGLSDVSPANTEEGALCEVLV